ncbi:MAG: hypothetical protein AB1861_26400 [Cyanobacteriota bacterium]
MKASLKRYRRFNLTFLTVTLSGFLAVGAFNFIVDPFGVTNSPIFSEFNELKIEKFNNVRLFKAVDVIRIKPKTILLGSSRSDLGLDPNHPALANQTPYNLGLVGPNMYEVRRYFDHALTNQPNLKTVVLGIDFFMFNDYSPNSPDFDENRLNQTSLTLKDSINTIFSISALEASKGTIASSLQSEAYFLYHSNGLRYVYGNKPDEPLKNKFEKMIEGFLEDKSYYARYRLSQKYLNDLRHIVETCQKKNIELKLFISPRHTIHSEAIKQAGLGSDFEEWQRELVKIATVWDFSGYNSITTEPISDQMKNYWDSSHYRKEVGDLILNRMFKVQEKRVPNDFGVLLTSDNIELQLAKKRVDHAVWTRQNPHLVKFVQEIERNVDREN